MSALDIQVCIDMASNDVTRAARHLLVEAGAHPEIVRHEVDEMRRAVSLLAAAIEKVTKQ